MRKKCFCCQATKTPSRLPFLSHPMNAIRITRGTLRRWHCVQVTLFPITTSLAKLSNISFPWIIKREEFTWPFCWEEQKSLWQQGFIHMTKDSAFYYLNSSSIEYIYPENPVRGAMALPLPLQSNPGLWVPLVYSEVKFNPCLWKCRPVLSPDSTSTAQTWSRSFPMLSGWPKQTTTTEF